MTTGPKIVVGVDGSSRGDDALAFGRLLAESVDATLLLTHAYGPAEARKEARATLEARRALAGDVEVELMPFADPSPARALYRVAAARHAGLVVVGASHRAGLGRVLPGSTGEQLLHGAPSAVAVVPHGWRPPEAGLRRIGCGDDGSPESETALGAAVELTRAVGGQLDVMQAFGSAPRSAADLEARAKAGLGRAVQELPKGVKARARMLAGDPARALIEGSPNLDVLVLGSRGLGPLRAVWAGSVSSHVTREAFCPVVVVPRGVRGTLIGPHPRHTTAQSA